MARLDGVAARVEEVAGRVAVLGRREKRPMQASLSDMPPHVPFGASAVPGRNISDGEAGMVQWYERQKE